MLPEAHAKELRITIPWFSSLTPVQRLNQEGVEAVRKHDLVKAQALFYKAYLYDPGDPFTLNNLGYSAELQGDADRAEQFYSLAEKQDCTADIDLSSLNELKGKPMLYALQDLQNASMRLNRMNVESIELLTHDRGFEAEILLRRALALDPGNPFTLNNLAVAEESVGDLEQAALHYNQAANLRSNEAIVVSPKKSWRGKPISQLAASGAQRVEARLESLGTAKARATMLTLQGVAALNENDWSAAKQDFQAAYALDPTSAFTLNNLGYVAEKTGDIETAQFYYAKAKRAGDADARIGLASRSSAEGEHLLAVADDSDHKVTGELDAFSASRRGEPASPQLVPRGAEATPAKPAPSANPPVAPSPAQQPQ
jgi:Flp pilus assembly protein TadD